MLKPVVGFLIPVSSVHPWPALKTKVPDCPAVSAAVEDPVADSPGYTLTCADAGLLKPRVSAVATARAVVAVLFSKATSNRIYIV